MYFCPLCTSQVHQQGFGSLDSLKAHLDLFHCSLTGNAFKRHTAVLADLETRIEKLVESQLPKERVQTVGSSRETAPLGGRLLRKYAREFDLASAENEYLRRKCREDTREWRQELDEERQRYEKLDKQFRGMVRIVEDTCRVQTEGKRRLEGFVDRLVTDMDVMEGHLEQANARIDMQIVSDQVQSRRSTEHQWEAPRENQRQNGWVSMEEMSGRTSGMKYSEHAGTDSGIDEYLETDKSIRHTPSRMTMQSNHLRASEYEYTEPFVTSLDSEDMENEDNLSQWKTQMQVEPQNLALVLVFRNLDALDLLKCAFVCRKWRDMSRHPVVWRTVRLKKKVITGAILKSISLWCTETVKLTLQNVGASRYEAQKRRERMDKGSNGILEDGLEEILRMCSDRLQFLKIVSCAPFITDRALWLAACHCKNLEKVVYISDQFPANAPSIWALGASCRMLSTLIIPSLPVPPGQSRRLHVDDEALLMISRCFPTTLKVLCIGGEHVTVTGLKYVAKSCQWLEALEVDHFDGLSRTTAKSVCAEGLKSLQMLNLTHCGVSAEALKCFCDRLPQIRSVRVVFSWRDFPSAKHVEAFLSECQKLLDENAAVRKILRLEERI